MKLSQEKIVQISKGDEEIAAVLTMMSNHIEHLENRVKELERQLNQNSQNSSKPPSSDGLRKPTNLRTPGGKKGAPKGHPGTTLHLVDNPDEVVVHELSSCPDCSCSLAASACEGVERRQVFDLPAPRMQTTEHRAEKRYCSHCKRLQRAAFPEHVGAPVQYGSGVAAWTVYLHALHMLPLERIAQLLEEITTYRPSEGTLLSFLETSYEVLKPAEETIQARLFEKEHVHADETGCRVNGKTHWFHVISDKWCTLLGVHPKRGSEAMDKLGFLPTYRGTVVHDCAKAYFMERYSFRHALCNAHLLRECLGILEHDHHVWAERMIALLHESWRLACASRQAGIPLEADVIASIQDQYDAILEAGQLEWEQDIVRPKTSSMGKEIKSKAGNLGERMSQNKASILSFLWRPNIPFDNNQAERDLRMVKVKQKVSGAFRTEEGAKIFARARSVISTLVKQGLPVLASLSHAFHRKPIL